MKDGEVNKDKGISPEGDRATAAEPAVSALRDGIPDAELVAFLRQEADEVARDMAGHVGDQIFDVCRRHGMMMRSEAGATAMLALAAVQLLEQAIDQCSRAAEDDCRADVANLFRNLLTEPTRAALDDAAIDLRDIPETTDFTNAERGKYHTPEPPQETEQ